MPQRHRDFDKEDRKSGNELSLPNVTAFLLSLCFFLLRGSGAKNHLFDKVSLTVTPSSNLWIPFLVSCSFRQTMFDTITAEIGTAAEKLAHLRRFL
jgi:hypothetical protein